MEKSSQDMTTTPRAEHRRVREIRTISRMVAMYCKGNHPEESRTETAECGERICPECAELDAYAVLRTVNCLQMNTKKSCEECGNHCYAPEMRARIREVMRWSGPHMITTHPIDAVRHLLNI